MNRKNTIFFRKNYKILFSFCILSLVFFTRNVNAQIIIVDDLQSLQDAIVNINENETIRLSATFPTNIAGPVIINIGHERNFTIDGNNKVLKITNGNKHFNLERSVASGILTLQNVTLKGMRTESDVNTDQRGNNGGGIYISTNNNGKFIFNNINFTHIAGGALRYNNNNIEIINSSFNFNVVEADHGGAISGKGDILIEHCTFNKNKNLWYGYSGGAIGFNGFTAKATISNSIFIGNTSDTRGGAISSHNGNGCSIIINSCYFEANETKANGGNSDGGAISVYAGYTSSATVVIDNSTFYKNIAGDDGGAVFLENQGATASNTIINNTMFENLAKDCAPTKLNNENIATSGGAIQASLATKITLENNTITGNYTTSSYKRGAGIGFHSHFDKVYIVPEITLKNNILTDNYYWDGITKTSDQYANISGADIGNGIIIDNGGNLGVDNGTQLPVSCTNDLVFGCPVPELWENFNTVKTGNPNETDPAFYRIIPTLSIKPDGSAFNMGTTSSLGKDQRGFQRNNPPQIGAVEIVYAKFDANGGKWSSLSDYQYKGIYYYLKDEYGEATEYYNISFPGGDVSVPVIDNPLKENDIFKYWAMDSIRGPRWDLNPLTLTENKELFAIWESSGIDPLPVELLSFETKCDGNYNLISWKTASETNNEYFIIERSYDLKNFHEIKRIQGAGDSKSVIEYNFTDNNISYPELYYRLTQVDYDGTKKTYDITFVSCKDNSGFEIDIFPNPFHNEITLSLKGFNSGNADLDIININGQVVYSVNLNINDSYFQKTITLDQLKPGIYNMRLKHSNDYIYRRIVRN